jgi:hypothetical protein
MDTARISLTAPYTGTVWQRAGLAHEAMRGATFYVLEPVMWSRRGRGGAADTAGTARRPHPHHRGAAVSESSSESIARA